MEPAPTPQSPSDSPGVFSYSSISAPPPVRLTVPVRRPPGLHHAPSEPLPLRLVSMTYGFV